MGQNFEECSTNSADTNVKHCELWASLSLVANMDNQDRGGPLHDGVLCDGADGQQVCEGVDDQRDGAGRVEIEYLPQFEQYL